MNSRKRPRPWFEDESYWKLTYPFMFPESRFAAAPEQVEKVLALARPRGKSALDLCCGPGRCSIALAERGFTVTGVDRTKFLLGKARERARAAGAKIEWVRADMRGFVRPRAYDLVLSIFTSFGYFASKAEDAVVLRNVFKSLRPGGVFVIDLMGKEILARTLQPVTSSTLPSGEMMVERHTILDGWDRIHNDWIVIRNGKARTFSFELNLYSGRELTQALESAGFKRVRLYGGLDGIPYDDRARRLVACAYR